MLMWTGINWSRPLAADLFFTRCERGISPIVCDWFITIPSIWKLVFNWLLHKSVFKTETSIMCTQKTHQDSGPHGCSNVTDVVDVHGDIFVFKSVYKTKYCQQQPDNQMKAWYNLKDFHHRNNNVWFPRYNHLILCSLLTHSLRVSPRISAVNINRSQGLFLPRPSCRTITFQPQHHARSDCWEDLGTRMSVLTCAPSLSQGKKLRMYRLVITFSTPWFRTSEDLGQTLSALFQEMADFISSCHRFRFRCPPRDWNFWPCWFVGN